MNLIFWLDSTPVCCRGIFDEVSKKWDGKTYYICNGQLSKERLKIQNEQEKYGKAELILLQDKQNKEAFISDFLDRHLDDIHIFNGYKSSTSKYLDLILKLNRKSKVIVWAERPGPPKWKCQFPWAIYHMKYSLKYRNKLAAFLPLGQDGVSFYKKVFWPKKKMFPFLYSPVMSENLYKHKDKKDNIVKFVYLGRFSAGAKGIDVLMEAVKQLKNKNYTLDMIGGYGDLKDKVLSWIDKTPNVNFGGTWPITEVCDRLYNYDVCIVPSKFEGWNVTINEALMAGIGCIVTDESVSDEMVKASNAGLVIKANNVDALAKGMDNVMTNINLIDKWKNAAYDYRKYINNDSLSNYFIEILNYLFKGNKNRPIPPWIL